VDIVSVHVHPRPIPPSLPPIPSSFRSFFLPLFFFFFPSVSPTPRSRFLFPFYVLRATFPPGTAPDTPGKPRYKVHSRFPGRPGVGERWRGGGGEEAGEAGLLGKEPEKVSRIKLQTRGVNLYGVKTPTATSRARGPSSTFLTSPELRPCIMNCRASAQRYIVSRAYWDACGFKTDRSSVRTGRFRDAFLVYARRTRRCALPFMFSEKVETMLRAGHERASLNGSAILEGGRKFQDGYLTFFFSLFSSSFSPSLSFNVVARVIHIYRARCLSFGGRKVNYRVPRANEVRLYFAVEL